MKIYTKAGDGGKTHLFGGQKVSKNDPRVDAYGQVDELNSFIGWIKSQTTKKILVKKLETLQNELFILGGDLATPPQTKTSKKIPRIQKKHIQRLEKEIDITQSSLPPQKHFILPGGGPTGASFHLARAICRRAERTLILLLKKNSVSKETQIYLNRLSDYLFLLGRQVNLKDKHPEIPWIPDRTVRG